MTSDFDAGVRRLIERPGVCAIRRLAAIGAIAGLAGCTTPLAPSSFANGTPELRPDVFFAGATRSTGVLESRSGAPIHRMHVEGSGRQLPDGSLQLDQTVTIEGEAPRVRTWVLRRLDAHHYAASLTDATGPVRGEAYGEVFHLRYPMKSPFGGEMDQWLYLQPDGRTVVNEATVRIAGVVVARLSERITGEGPKSDKP